MKESLIYGLLGGFIGFLYMGWICYSKSSPSHMASFAVVDMQLLISKKSQQLALQLTSEKLQGETNNQPSPVSIQESANSLKEDLNTFAATHNLVLLAKGAVIGGDVPDKTQEILELLEEKEIDHE